MSNTMSILERIGYNVFGFLLCFATATFAAVGLHALVAIVWIPLPTLLFDFGSRFVIVSAALGSSVICLLWWLKNEDMKRGVWCFTYALFGVAIVGLTISLFQ